MYILETVLLPLSPLVYMYISLFMNKSVCVNIYIYFYYSIKPVYGAQHPPLQEKPPRWMIFLSIILIYSLSGFLSQKY